MLKVIVESKLFERLVVVVIALNAVTLGLETSPDLAPSAFEILTLIDKACLTFFTLEVLAKLVVYRLRFFRDPWRVFDFVIVAMSLLPSAGPFSVVRSLRILRTLRMISVIPALKRVVNGLLYAIPGLGAVGAVLGLLFYVGAVMATKLFATEFPEWFGTIGRSFYTLFQVMTLESWSMGIVRPVMQTFPYAWLFFVPFILVTSFTMLNLFIAVIVNAMHVDDEKVNEKRDAKSHDERVELLKEIRILQRKVDELMARR